MSSTSLITSISATPHAPPTTSSSFSSIPIQSGQPGSSGQPSPSGPPSPLGGPPSPPGQSTSLGPSSSGHTTPSVQSSPSAQPSRSAQPSQSVQPRQSNDHHLSDGAVAGVVIGAAVALALITFLVTFLFMRSRQHNQGSKRRRSGANGRGTMELGTLREHGKSPEPKRPLVTEQTVMSRGPGTWESYLPQSADDKAVKNNVSTLLEQIELHVENFYHNSTVSIGKDAHVELSKFDSPYLPAPLLTLFPQSRSRSPLITHCLTRFIVSSISPTANPERSFLPLDFVVLPNTIETYKSGKPKKPGFDEVLARWRVLSAYLRPNPVEDSTYISRRDRTISEALQAFSRAFAPWQNPKYRDEDRVRSLTEIMKSAADLGIWLFSQPSTFKFHWGTPENIEAHTIVVAPALLKVADESAQSLSKAQVMIEMVIRRL